MTRVCMEITQKFLNKLDSVYVYVYVVARAGVIFGIYFTSCRCSGG